MLFSLADLRMISGLSDKTLRNMLKDGRIKGEKINGKWMFRVQQIQEALDDDSVIGSLNSKLVSKISNLFDGYGSVINGKNGTTVIAITELGDEYRNNHEKSLCILENAVSTRNVEVYRYNNGSKVFGVLFGDSDDVMITAKEIKFCFNNTEKERTL